MSKLRIYWVAQVPMTAFMVEVRTLREARLLLTTLANYDLFQLKHRIKPDFCNAGGLQVFDPTDHEDSPTGSWIGWCDEETGEEFSDLTDQRIEELDRAASES